MRHMLVIGTLGALVTLGAGVAGGQAANPHGSVIEHDSLVAVEQPGTHGGGGMSTGYSFFSKEPGLALVFRKRALHPGAGIGYHEQKEDEIYYVLSGRGAFTLDGTTREVGPGTAMLTRTGSSHGIRTLGNQDLVLLISYEQPVARDARDARARRPTPPHP